MPSKMQRQNSDRTTVKQSLLRPIPQNTVNIFNSTFDHPSIATSSSQSVLLRKSLSKNLILQLQNTIGNQSTGRILGQTTLVQPTRNTSGTTSDLHRLISNKVTTIQRGRPAGISTQLAKARWNMKKRKNVTFKQWKQGYEAQHIIPWAVAVKLSLPTAHLNEAWNGMMLPSGRKNARLPVYKASVGERFHMRPRHIKKGLAHPLYNAYVQSYIEERLRKGDKPIITYMKKWAQKLRLKTKALKPHLAVDDMT